MLSNTAMDNLKKKYNVKHTEKREKKQIAQKYGMHANLVKKQQFEEEEKIDMKKNIDTDSFDNQSIGRRISTGIDAAGRTHLPRTWTDGELVAIGIHLKKVRREAHVAREKLESLCGFIANKLAQAELGLWKGFGKEQLKTVCHFIGADVEDFLLEALRKDVAIAVPGGKSFQRKKYDREEFVGKDFTISYEINESTFCLKITNDMGIGISDYTGKKYRQNDFLEALEEAIKAIRKSF